LKVAIWERIFTPASMIKKKKHLFIKTPLRGLKDSKKKVKKAIPPFLFSLFGYNERN